jgi:hypothetical protein
MNEEVLKIRIADDCSEANLPDSDEELNDNKNVGNSN